MRDFCGMSEDNLNVTDDAAIRPWNVPERDILSDDEQIFFQPPTCQCPTTFKQVQLYESEFCG